MRTKTNDIKSYSPIDIVIGEQEEANYKYQVVPAFQNNPLIEALPEVLSKEKVTESLAHFPEYSKEQRDLPEEIRILLLENAREFFLPQSRHIELYYTVASMIRWGYVNRNPLNWGYWNEVDKKLNKLQNDFNSGIKTRKFVSKSNARGFAIIGGGGNGKTAGIENDLSLMPQVIEHKHYQGNDLILKQLVWLKMDCPQDGSIKGLCKEFFQTVDEIINTDYYYFYGRKNNTIDDMLLSMARIAAMHSLGVIVIDEIQDLSQAKSGGANHLLNFFVHLENRIGVPYVFIGTPKVKEIFNGEFRQARRASEQGDFYWDRIPQNAHNDKKTPHKDWDDFVRIMFTYQYIKKIKILPKNILDDPVVRALYHHSQGIPAIILTLFILAQRRAILSNEEELTVNIIRSVEKDRLNLIRQAMDSIRAGNEIETDILDDIDPTKYLAILRARKYLNLTKNNHNLEDEASEFQLNKSIQTDEINSDADLTSDSNRVLKKTNKQTKREVKKTSNKKEFDMNQHIESGVEFL